MKAGATSFILIVKALLIILIPSLLVAVTIYVIAFWLVLGVPVIVPVLGLKFISAGSAAEIVYVIVPVTPVRVGLISSFTLIIVFTVNTLLERYVKTGVIPKLNLLLLLEL